MRLGNLIGEATTYGRLHLFLSLRYIIESLNTP